MYKLVSSFNFTKFANTTQLNEFNSGILPVSLPGFPMAVCFLKPNVDCSSFSAFYLDQGSLVRDDRLYSSRVPAAIAPL